MANSQKNLITLKVPDDVASVRLDVWLAKHLKSPEGLSVSRAKIQSLLSQGEVHLNGKPVSAKTKVCGGESIEVCLAPSPASALEPIAMPLAIIYEDAHLLVLDKPKGVSMHPGAGEPSPTLVQGVLHYVRSKGDQLSQSSGLIERPGIVHRLDKDTTGVVVIAKTDFAHAGLAKQFHDKTNQRSYLALLCGVMAQEKIDYESYLYRDPQDRRRFQSLSINEAKALKTPPGRYAKSYFYRKTIYGHRLTLAQVILATGRTHQIRVHARELGLPILGDPVYNRPIHLPRHFDPEACSVIQSVSRQMLHAETLGFLHPVTGQSMQFSAPLPGDFKQILEVLRPYAQNVIC